MTPSSARAKKRASGSAIGTRPTVAGAPTAAAVGRYLDADAALRAIERLGSEDRPLTVVIGAGVSMEAGLPSWNELVRSLLNAVIERRLPPRLQRAWVQEVEQEGLLAAAAIARSSYTREYWFEERLRRTLYAGRPASEYRPQALAREIARLKQREPSTTLITTNYDGLIEVALDDLGLAPKSYIRARREPEGHAAVYHLHGRLMPAYPRTGRLVLTEEDYATVQQPIAWQERFMLERLRDTVCLFVGLSLRDVNLVRWLYRYDRAANAPPHLALFVRQGLPELDARVRTELERAAHRRWGRRGVDVIDLDFYGEVAQFLHEVGLARSGSPLPTFDERARRALALGEATLVPPDDRDFRQVQLDASDWLNELLDEVRAILVQGGHDPGHEVMSLGIWGVNHAEGTTTLWATSDRSLTSPSGLISRPFAYRSPWVAVQAVTQGVAVEDDPDIYASPWRLIQGIPVTIPGPAGDGRVIAGALTLTSDLPVNESVLGGISPATRQELHETLEASARFVFEA